MNAKQTNIMTQTFFSDTEAASNNANPYLIRCAINGDAIEGADTIEEAAAIIAEYEAEDKEQGNYCPDFYEIYEVVRDEVVNIA
jgi:hypothetical protein